jgi:signal transduction histidine kinase
MRERAEMAGGWFRLESDDGEGTVVEFSLPALVAG